MRVIFVGSPSCEYELRFEAPVAKSFCELNFEKTSYKKLLRDELPGIKKTCKLPSELCKVHKLVFSRSFIKEPVSL